MMEEIKIRKHHPADTEAILRLFRLNTPGYFAPGEEKDLEDYLLHHAENYFVITSSGELVGCGGYNFSEDKTVGIISWDFFHPSHQGKGLGSMLTKYRIERLKEVDSVKTIMVRTSQFAFKFYRKFGFELVEVAKNYWAEGFDLYKMEFPVDRKPK